VVVVRAAGVMERQVAKKEAAGMDLAGEVGEDEEEGTAVVAA